MIRQHRRAHSDVPRAWRLGATVATAGNFALVPRQGAKPARAQRLRFAYMPRARAGFALQLDGLLTTAVAALLWWVIRFVPKQTTLAA